MWRIGLRWVYTADKVLKAGDIFPNLAQDLQIHLHLSSRDLFL
jgi:hypothetical protein